MWLLLSTSMFCRSGASCLLQSTLSGLGTIAKREAHVKISRADADVLQAFVRDLLMIAWMFRPVQTSGGSVGLCSLRR